MGNSLSTNLKKTAFLCLDLKRSKSEAQKFSSEPSIGILSFEVASIMSKSVQLWQSLSELEVRRIRTELAASAGVRFLVSEDEDYLLGLVCAEKFEDLDSVACAVSRLGKKCREPALIGFEHVYSDLLCGSIDFRDLEFLVKDMDARVKKMKRFMSAMANLYQDLKVLTDIEHSARKLQRYSQNVCGRSFYALRQKILCQKQEIKHLRNVSLWNQSYDKVVGLLARTVCAIYGRICTIFGTSAILGSVPVELRGHFSSKCKLGHAPPSTLGGAALALHYANVIILLEKLVRCPQLVDHHARDDLYQMLPTTVRMALRSRLKSYAKNLASPIYDAPLAADWKGALEKILEWLAPLAHNMITWQSQHSFEQQKVVSTTNVILLQTLYFADQSKTEETITELLVGLNYVCRYEQEIRVRGLMDCSNEDYVMEEHEV